MHVQNKCLTLQQVKQLNTLSMNNVKSLSENIAKAVSETTKHVEFLAAAYPEIRTNLQTIAETLQVVHHSLGTVCELSEMQEKVHKPCQSLS